MSAEVSVRADIDGPASNRLDDASLARRRLVAGLLNLATVFLLGLWFVQVIGGQSRPFAALMILAFLIYVPGPVIWFWNALIGFLLFNASCDPVTSVVHPAKLAHADDPILLPTAIVMTLRNGDRPARSFAHLKAMKAMLDRSGFGALFHYFILSDSTSPRSIAGEEEAFAAWCEAGSIAAQVFYRRRSANVGFKAGNLRDFCERWGSAYNVMVLLDSDSVMTAELVLRTVRIMHANPRLGILQTLPAGLPADSLFARILQFGHFHLMRCFVAGASWWQGDCNRPRGHNCAIRVAPFLQYCGMPEALGGNNIPHFCHDQIEAALMYRAGYEIWFLPEMGGSFESYPPTVLELLDRQHRWCQGDVQNLKIFLLPQVANISRFNLLFLAQKYFGALAAIVFVVLIAVAPMFRTGVSTSNSGSRLALYLLLVGIYIAPRLFSIAQAALLERQRNVNVLSLLGAGLIDLLFTLLLLPITLFSASLSLLALPFNRSVKWDEQRRENHCISWSAAWRRLWPQTIFGFAELALLAAVNPRAIPWILPFLSGLILAVPFAVLSSSERIGRWAALRHLCALSYEADSPLEIRAEAA